MEYIYHAVPPKMEGFILYPLFQLKEKFPQVYDAEIKKYDDHPQRKELPFKKVIKLNCTRGDVLQCSPVHPNRIFVALKSVFPEGNRAKLFYKIPIEMTQNLPLVLFDMNKLGYEFGKEEPETVFELLNSANYREISEVPKEAIAFYEEWKVRGAQGAPAWGKIPHIFIQGNMDITGCEIIDWKDPILS